jgi:hypothetical protein
MSALGTIKGGTRIEAAKAVSVYVGIQEDEERFRQLLIRGQAATPKRLTTADYGTPNNKDVCIIRRQSDVKRKGARNPSMMWRESAPFIVKFQRMIREVALTLRAA